jgi:hypothetical protein
MKENVKRIYDNITPVGTSAAFADKVIERSQAAKSMKENKPVRFALPIFAGCAAAVAIMSAGMFLLGGGEEHRGVLVPPMTRGSFESVGKPIVTEPTVTSSEPPDSSGTSFPTEWIAEYNFAETVNVWFTNTYNNRVHEGSTGRLVHESFRVKRVAFSSVGIEIDYVPEIPYWAENTHEIFVLPSGFLFYEGRNRFSDIEFFFDGMRRTVTNRLWNEFDDWKAVRFSFENENLSGGVMRSTLTFVDPIDFTGLREVWIGGTIIDFEQDYSSGKLIKPTNLSARDSELYDIVSLINRPEITVLWKHGLEGFEGFEDGADSFDYGAWIMFEMDEVEKMHYEIYSRQFKFDPALYGKVVERENGVKYIAPPWAGGSAGLNFVMTGNRTNADGTITLSGVRGVAPNHGDERIMVFAPREIRKNGVVITVEELEEMRRQNLPEDGLEWIPLGDDLVLGYTCPFTGLLHYYPEIAEKLPTVEYTFIRESGKYKILSVETVN